MFVEHISQQRVANPKVRNLYLTSLGPFPKQMGTASQGVFDDHNPSHHMCFLRTL